MSEQIYMAISEDGRQWQALKDGKPVPGERPLSVGEKWRARFVPPAVWRWERRRG